MKCAEYSNFWNYTNKKRIDLSGWVEGGCGGGGGTDGTGVTATENDSKGDEAANIVVSVDFEKSDDCADREGSEDGKDSRTVWKVSLT